MGLATRKIDLNKLPFGGDSEAWVLRNDGCVYTNNVLKFRIAQSVDEGDVIVGYF